MKSRTFTFIALLLFVVSTALGGIVYKVFGNMGTAGPTPLSRHYVSDEFFLFGKDAAGQPFLAELLFQRKQTETGEYTHYYTLDLLTENHYSEQKKQEKNISSEIGARGFLKKFAYTPALDLSARGGFVLTFSDGNQDYTLDTATLDSEFLVRNKPNYTKSASMGQGVITTKGVKLPVSLVHLSSYSEDYSEFIFFKGYYQLKSTAHLLILWDSIGNTYLVDKSLVSSVQQNYQSHTWVLRKDAEGMSTKAFAASLSYDNEELPYQWEVSIPTLENTRFSFKVEYNNDKSTGFAHGTVSDKQGTRNLEGYALITHY